MKPIANTVDDLFQPRELAEDEYLNEADGLIYCSKCHTPRQHHIELKERVFLPTVRCRCQQEEYDKEEAERKHQEFLMQVSRLKANGLQDKSLHDYNFSNDKGYNPEMQKAHEYVSHWEEMKANSLRLLLWGDVGTGKSFFAGCIANALLDKGIPILMTNFSRILNELTKYHADKNEIITGLVSYPLLIIDDLGIERNSEFALEMIYNVVDRRYCTRKPLIVTTNLSYQDMTRKDLDIEHQRIYSRLMEMCFPVIYQGKDQRQKERDLKLEWMKLNGD